MTEEAMQQEAYRRFTERTKSIKCPICQSEKIFYPHDHGEDANIIRDEEHGTHYGIYYVLHCLNCAYEMKFCANEYITNVDVELGSVTQDNCERE